MSKFSEVMSLGLLSHSVWVFFRIVNAEIRYAQHLGVVGPEMDIFTTGCWRQRSYVGQ